MENAKTLRVIICGGRDFDDYNLLVKSCNEILSNDFARVEVVSGFAKGADMLGIRYALENNLKHTAIPADWDAYGKRAGFIRNVQMENYILREDPMVIAFWDGKSKGTKDMIEKSKGAGIPVHVISY